MKKLLIIPGLLLTGFLLFQAFTGPVQDETPNTSAAWQILKTSCYDCHSDLSKNFKAKTVLNFDKWDTYNTGKKISRLADICDHIEKEKMPPKKYLESNPGKALSDEAKKAVCTWTDEETEKLMAEE
jgi:hypothetical protein